MQKSTRSACVSHNVKLNVERQAVMRKPDEEPANPIEQIVLEPLFLGGKKKKEEEADISVDK